MHDWSRCEISLRRLHQKHAERSEWTPEAKLELKATICELNSCLHTQWPPAPLSNSPASSGPSLAEALFQLSSIALGDVQRWMYKDADVADAILWCTAQFLCAVQTAPGQAENSMSETGALIREEIKTSLTPAVEGAVKFLNIVWRKQKDLSADTVQRLYQCSAVVLQLAFVITRIWPAGMLPTHSTIISIPAVAQLAATVLQGLKHAPSGFRPAPVVTGAAVFALETLAVQQVHCSNESQLHSTFLFKSEGFWLLFVLMLHAQLQQYYTQQQQEQATPASSQLHSSSPDEEQLQQHAASMTNLLGDDMFLLWQQQACWREHSSSQELCKTLLLLADVLHYWSVYSAPDTSIVFAGLQSADILQHKAQLAAAISSLLILLLQLAGNSSQSPQQFDVCIAAISAAGSAVDCIDSIIVRSQWDFDKALLTTLMKQSTGLVHQVLQQHTISVVSPTAASTCKLLNRLLSLLEAVVQLAHTCSALTEQSAKQIAHAMECCIRAASTAAVADTLFANDTYQASVLYQCVESALCAYDIPGPLLQCALDQLPMLSASAGAADSLSLLMHLVALAISVVKVCPPASKVEASHGFVLHIDVLTACQCTATSVLEHIQHSGSSSACSTGAAHAQSVAAAWVLLLCRIIRLRCQQLLHSVQEITSLFSLCFGSSSSSSSIEGDASDSRNSSSVGDAADATCRRQVAQQQNVAVSLLNGSARVMALMQSISDNISDRSLFWTSMSGCTCSNSISSTSKQSQSLPVQQQLLEQNAWKQIEQLKHSITLCQKNVMLCRKVALELHSRGIMLPTTTDLVDSSTDSSSYATHTDFTAAVHAAQSVGDVLLALQRYVMLQQLPGQLLAAVDALCALLPVSCCCNNPGCGNLSGQSELQLVGGKSCVCAGCKTARYCSRSCQQQHWKLHKPVCMLRAEASSVSNSVSNSVNNS